VLHTLGEGEGGGQDREFHTHASSMIGEFVVSCGSGERKKYTLYLSPIFITCAFCSGAATPALSKELSKILIQK